MSRPPSRLVTALDRILIPGDLLMTVRASACGHSLFVDRDVRLFYEVAGGGARTIVFVPGPGQPGRIFRGQLSHFEPSTEFRALVLDPRGQRRAPGCQADQIR